LYKKLQDLGFLGIVGMGGIGKSTLANALSDHVSHKFGATCFVGDFTCESCTIQVKYNLQDVIEPPQTKTLKEGHKLLKQLQDTKKILIVLDNVGNASQLEVLLGDRTYLDVHGSKVIATSRSWECLKRHVPTIGKVDMETLDKEKSKELFSLHAFATDQSCLHDMYLQLVR
jgi:ABC-type dipeptide/oligopeptide/nickel transport system ATPase subunit